MPCFTVRFLRSKASFTRRSVSSRIACFDISYFLAFGAIGHTGAREPRQMNLFCHHYGSVYPRPRWNRCIATSVEEGRFCCRSRRGEHDYADSDVSCRVRVGPCRLLETKRQPYRTGTDGLRHDTMLTKRTRAHVSAAHAR
jgi:hypothetical protein